MAEDDERLRLEATALHLKQQGVAQCPVCMDVLTEPARLVCRHSFCRGCIDTVLGLASAVAARPRCPVCNVEFRRREVSASDDMGQLVDAYRGLQSVVRRRAGAPPDSQEAEVEDMPPPALAAQPAATRPTPAKKQPRAPARSTPKPARCSRKPKAAKPRASATSAAAASAAAAAGRPEMPPVADAGDAAAPAPAPKPRPRPRRSRPARADRTLSEEEQLALALKLSMQDERIQR